MTTIQHLIEKIDEKRKQHKRDTHEISRNHMAPIPLGEKIEWSVNDEMKKDFLETLADSYDQLREAALAGAELAKAVKGIKLELDVVVCECGEPYKGTDPSVYTDAALQAYREAIKD